MTDEEYLKLVAYTGVSNIPDDDGLIYYSKFDGSYITRVGMEDTITHLVKRVLTEQLQHGTGFSPTEQKWYGWSHRAIYGFGVGSKVSSGDCAYSPTCKEDYIQESLKFWNIDDGIWRECESPDVTCTTSLVSFDDNYMQDNQLGFLLVSETKFKGADRDYTRSIFTPYPEQYGKGEWIAETLEDAKQMAIDFSGGVS
jgi:hypothetical protein